MSKDRKTPSWLPALCYIIRSIILITIRRVQQYQLLPASRQNKTKVKGKILQKGLILSQIIGAMQFLAGICTCTEASDYYFKRIYFPFVLILGLFTKIEAISTLKQRSSGANDHLKDAVYSYKKLAGSLCFSVCYREVKLINMLLQER